MTEEEVQFPHYQPPGTPVATKKEAGPLMKMMTRMLPKKIKPRLMGRVHPKGLQSDQSVHVKHKKVRFY